MQVFSKDKIYNFMGKSNFFISFSIVLILSSYFFLYTKGLNYGIDFAGGTIVQVKYDKTAPIKQMRENITKDKAFENASITQFGSPQEVIIRFSTAENSTVKNDAGDKIKTLLKGTGDFQIRRVDIVGPKVGGELREKGMMALVMSIIVILIYVAFRFEWRFAVASVLALVHDVSIAMGAIALFQVDVNLDVLAALLTLMGYSLNDTIIVFDRIREGIGDTKETNLFNVINDAVSKTLSRTLLTSLTTFFVILTLYALGGEIISSFSFTLLVGIVVGTYSSVFVASPMLKWLGFDLQSYKAKEALKAKRKIEKEKARAMYEKGML
ncbi:protein translocase subunit SecF [Sulfurospirillum sp. 1612]|uniref:protein translocase subunit SecF n=1 Tax=Sulfurospirillum sp. 1612 TaxID=3094835 RepID=UPI002F9493C4